MNKRKTVTQTLKPTMTQESFFPRGHWI
jgi:hypothetical protein